MNLGLYINCLTIFLRYGFVDRADVVQYFDLPSFDAVYEIHRTCMCKIILKGMVDKDNGIIGPNGQLSSKLNHAKGAR